MGTIGNKLNRLSVLFAILFILILTTILIAWQNQKEFKKRIVTQWEDQLLTTTRISAINIESFFQKFSENLLSVSNNPIIQKRSLGTKLIQNDSSFCCVENLFKIHNKDINSISLLNKDGLILRKYPPIEDTNKNLLYSKWGLETIRELSPGDINISNVFTNSMGITAISISSPIFYNNEFSGMVRWMIELSNLSSKYIDSVSVGKNGYMWLIDHDGVIRAHHDPTFLGLKPEILTRDYKATQKVAGYNLKLSLKYIEESELFFNSIKNNMAGVGNIIDYAHNEHSLAVFKKVNLGNREWTLVMNIPYVEIVNPIYKNARKNYGFAAFAAILLSLIFISIYQSQKKRIELEKEATYLSKIAKSADDLKEERQKRLTAQIDGQEIERSRVSRELHDGLGQQLLAQKVKLEELSSNVPEKFNNLIQQIRNMFLKTIDETKRISNNLMPVTLDELGLKTALSNLCDDFEQIKIFKIDYVTHGIPEHLSIKQKTYLYRIAQEALNNIVKHAEAKEVNIQLLGNDEQITLIIQDDGKGFDYTSKFKNSGNGIHNIKDRTEILGGVVNIQSSTEEGTLISVKIPLVYRYG